MIKFLKQEILNIKWWQYLILVLSFFYIIFYSNNVFYQLNEPTILNCIERSPQDLLSLWFGPPCCCHYDHQPALFFNLKAWAFSFGDSITSLKLFSIIFYILSSLVIILYANISFKSKTSKIFFCLFTIFNTALIHYGQLVYMYIHYFFFVISAFFILRVDLISQKTKSNLVIIFLGISGLYFYFGYLYLGLFIILALKKKYQFNKPLALIAILPCFLKLPLIFYFRFFLRNTESYGYDIRNTLSSIVDILFGISQYNKLIIFCYVLVLLLIITLIIIKRDQIFFKKDIHDNFLILTTLVSIIVFLTFRLGLRLDEIMPRYFIPWVFIFYLLFFRLYEIVESKNMKGITNFIIVFLTISTCSNLYMFYNLKPKTFYKLIDQTSYLKDNQRLTYFINYESMYYFKAMFEKHYHTKLNSKLLEKKQNCSKIQSEFYIVDRIKNDPMAIPIKDFFCLEKYDIQKKIIKLKTYPREWIIYKFRYKEI